MPNSSGESCYARKNCATGKERPGNTPFPGFYAESGTRSFLGHDTHLRHQGAYDAPIWL